MSDLPIARPIEDFSQSANALFHFMKKPEYLRGTLARRALVPRYCLEDTSYFGSTPIGEKYSQVAVLEKCFCDIPIHDLTQTFEIQIIDNDMQLSPEKKIELSKQNTHLDYYGYYGIAFSKHWGENKNLQPVHYINDKSEDVNYFSDVFMNLLEAEELPDSLSKDIVCRIALMKPLRGIMTRSDDPFNHGIKVKIYKNFYDEQEWRYIPSYDLLESLPYPPIIGSSYILGLNDSLELFNQNLESERYKALWLEYDFDDIRYLIVPNANERLSFIDFIMNLSEKLFSEPDKADREKQTLISKILVFDEIRKDW